MKTLSILTSNPANQFFSQASSSALNNSFLSPGSSDSSGFYQELSGASKSSESIINKEFFGEKKQDLLKVISGIKNINVKTIKPEKHAVKDYHFAVNSNHSVQNQDIHLGSCDSPESLTTIKSNVNPPRVAYADIKENHYFYNLKRKGKSDKLNLAISDCVNKVLSKGKESEKAYLYKNMIRMILSAEHEVLLKEEMTGLLDRNILEQRIRKLQDFGNRLGVHNPLEGVMENEKRIIDFILLKMDPKVFDELKFQLLGAKDEGYRCCILHHLKLGLDKYCAKSNAHFPNPYEVMSEAEKIGLGLNISSKGKGTSAKSALKPLNNNEMMRQSKIEISSLISERYGKIDSMSKDKHWHFLNFSYGVTAEHYVKKSISGEFMYLREHVLKRQIQQALNDVSALNLDSFSRIKARYQITEAYNKVGPVMKAVNSMSFGEAGAELEKYIFERLPDSVNKIRRKNKSRSMVNLNNSVLHFNMKSAVNDKCRNLGLSSPEDLSEELKKIIEPFIKKSERNS